MTELSPAAKAVLDKVQMTVLMSRAANNENSCEIAAAALRAAAKELWLRSHDLDALLEGTELSHPADVLNTIADELCLAHELL